MKHENKGSLTRKRIIDRALQLFRKQGFEETTMRQIANAAQLSLGAAYHYFSSKDDIVLAYYQRHQDELEATMKSELGTAIDLRERLGILMHRKLDAIYQDQKLLGTLLSNLVNPHSPVGAFSKTTRDIRNRGIALFEDVLAQEPAISQPVKILWSKSLWLLQMGFCLFFLWDESVDHKKTRKLVDETLDILLPLLQLSTQPYLNSLIERVLAIGQSAHLFERRG